MHLLPKMAEVVTFLFITFVTLGLNTTLCQPSLITIGLRAKALLHSHSLTSDFWKNQTLGPSDTLPLSVCMS